MNLKHSTFLIIILSVCHLSFQSPSTFSLQPAVQALSDREAQLALKDEIENGNIDDFIDNDEFEWNNDYDLERGQPSKAKARYLARTNADYNDNFPGYKKRAMYRKRDGSVFRERSRIAPHHQQQQQAVLADKFLKAIEDEREREREDEYREELKSLWNRYQKEESDIAKELFNDIENDSDYPMNNDEEAARATKKKRQRGEVEQFPLYWNDNKRSMPLLPWLPATRKKRFPVTKRSPKMNENEMVRAVAETSDKVSKDLQGIFGSIADDNKKVDDEEDKKKKKKRSSDDNMIHENSEQNREKKQDINQPPPSSAMFSNVDDVKKRNVKRSTLNNDDDDDEDDDDNESKEAGEDEFEVNDDSEEDDSKRKRRKKKREAKKSLENMGDEDIPEKKFSIKKKSVQWSNIFGFDRKKKSNGMLMNYGVRGEFEDKRRRKRNCIEDETGAESCNDNDDDDDDDDNDNDDDNGDNDDEKKRRKRKRSRGEERLTAMDRKLKNMENLIIEDTAKYYEHHNGNISPSELNEMRSQLADRLATAYSLEKMRKAIGRLRQSMAFQKGIEQNLIEAVDNYDDNNNNDDDDKKKAKRVAVKKEKAEFDNNDHEIETSLKKVSEEEKNNLDDNDDDKKKKKKKRSQKKSNVINEEAPMSEGYMGGKIFQNECPLLDAIEKRCRGVDILSGDSHHNLLEACGEHQLCYLCGDSELQCDYKFLYDIKEVCGYNSKCKMSAAQALSTLRTFSVNKIGPRECIRNPCLNSAIRSIEY